ncbi:uncharacterized protein [Diadema antillarum]|uniref:uncharacterized protein n=1 Tax=Diadema antillarum TaxID=105358 RepID=UPI003A84CA18
MGGGEGLIVSNSIKVLTQNGQCQIDLCLGDITKLPMKDKVDVIVVSAFRGDYTPTPTSVIGALKRNLGMEVWKLAKDKEEDLRNLYSCWWSKPMSKKLPYKRLLCFETRRMMDGRPQELVANVFRCLVPILNNEDGTVITPLLNTGDQGYGEVSMLKGMVEAAVNWMKAGLPLRVMKLVLYAKVEGGKLQNHTLRRFDEVLKKFGELKERYEMQLLIPKAVPLEFDVYLSFSEEDEEVVKVIRERLGSAKDGVRIFDSSNQNLNRDNVFQQDMYSVMMKSARVVTVLSPNYLKNKACIEQYNIALCCNRRAHRDMLAPFYVDDVELMPTYMGLVQYVDCRPHDAEKIQDACSQLTVSLSITLHTELQIAEFDPLRYDVFLSYSHRDTEKANLFVKALQKLAPDLKLFFDVQELKTGKSWQRTLYHSIDGSRCMVALISAPYLKSAVCQEEFALAQAKHFSKGKQHLQLIPVCLEDLDSIQPEFTQIPMVKATPDILEDTVKTLCPAVVQWLKGEKVQTSQSFATIFDDEKVRSLSPDEEMVAFRKAQFQREFGTLDQLFSTKPTFPPSLDKVLLQTDKDARPRSAADCDIIFSHHSDDQKYADFMSSILKLYAPALKVKTVASNEHEKLSSLERSDCIVPILSPNYLESPECVEEFHIAIWRQRIANPDAPLLMPLVVHILPQKPTYFHLVDCPVNLTDDIWALLVGKLHVGLPEEIEEMRQSFAKLSRADALAILVAAYKILQRFAKAREAESVDGYSPKAALFNVLKLQADTKRVTQPDYTEEISQILVDLRLSDIPESWRKEGQSLHSDDGEIDLPDVPSILPSEDTMDMPDNDTSKDSVPNVHNTQPSENTIDTPDNHTSIDSGSNDVQAVAKQPAKEDAGDVGNEEREAEANGDAEDQNPQDKDTAEGDGQSHEPPKSSACHLI